MTDQQFLVVIGYLEGAYRMTFRPNEVQVWRVELDAFDPEVALYAAREYVDAGNRFAPTLADLKPVARRIQAARREKVDSERRLESLRALTSPSQLPPRRPEESIAQYVTRLNETGIA